MIKAVIFDCGAVMHSLEGTNSRADILQVLVAGGLTEEAIESEYKEQVQRFGNGEITEEEFWNVLCTKANVVIPDNYKDLWRKKFKDNARAYPEMFALVDDLKRSGYKVYILSNTVAPHAEVIKNNGWYDPFDGVFLSNELKMRKPSKNIYQYVLDRAELKPEEAVFIDDREENLIPAKELGMATILAITPDQVIKDLNDLLEINKF